MSTSAVLPAHLVKVQVRGTKLIAPLQEEVESISIVTEADYHDADALLNRIGTAIKTWDGEMEPILKPLREAKTAADKLKAKVNKPLTELYEQVRYAMTEWKRADIVAKAKAKELEDRAKAKVNERLEKVATQETTARTAQMRERLAAKRVELEQEAEAIPEALAPVKATHSQARTVKRWRVVDRDKAIRGLMEDVDSGFVLIDTVAVNKLSAQPGGWDAIASWPGFEVFEDVMIAGRG